MLAENSLTSYNVEYITNLINKGTDLDAKNEKGQTALMLAIENGFQDIALLLIKKVEDVNIADKYGKTALMLAAKNAHADVVNKLTTLYLNIYLSNEYRLNLANIHTNLRVYKARIINGSKVIDEKDAEGKTALDIAFTTFLTHIQNVKTPKDFTAVTYNYIGIIALLCLYKEIHDLSLKQHFNSINKALLCANTGKTFVNLIDDACKEYENNNVIKYAIECFKTKFESLFVVPSMLDDVNVEPQLHQMLLQ